MVRQALLIVGVACVFTLGCAGSAATPPTNPLSLPKMNRAEAIAGLAASLAFLLGCLVFLVPFVVDSRPDR